MVQTGDNAEAKKKKIGCMSDLDTWLDLRYVERRM